MADEVVNDDHGGVLFEGVAVAYQAGDFVKRQAEEFAHFAVAVVRTEVGRQFQIVVVEGVGADAVFGLRGVADDADRACLSRQRFRNGRFFVAFFDEVGKDADAVGDAARSYLIQFARLNAFRRSAARNPHMRYAVARGGAIYMHAVTADADDGRGGTLNQRAHRPVQVGKQRQLFVAPAAHVAFCGECLCQFGEDGVACGEVGGGVPDEAVTVVAQVKPVVAQAGEVVAPDEADGVAVEDERAVGGEVGAVELFDFGEVGHGVSLLADVWRSVAPARRRASAGFGERASAAGRGCRRWREERGCWPSGCRWRGFFSSRRRRW